MTVLVRVVDTLIATDSAGNTVDATIVRAEAGLTALSTTGVPVDVVQAVADEDAGFPVYVVLGHTAMNAAGVLVDSIPMSADALGNEFPNSITVNPSFIYELDGWTTLAIIGSPPAVGWADNYAILHRVDASNYNAVRQAHTLVIGNWYQVTASVLGAYAVLVRVGDTAGGQQTVAEFTVAGGATEVVVFQATATTHYLQARSQSNGQDTNLDLLMIEPSTAPGYTPSLDFSDARNSQYLPLI